MGITINSVKMPEPSFADEQIFYGQPKEVLQDNLSRHESRVYIFEKFLKPRTTFTIGWKELGEAIFVDLISLTRTYFPFTYQNKTYKCYLADFKYKVGQGKYTDVCITLAILE